MIGSTRRLLFVAVLAANGAFVACSSSSSSVSGDDTATPDASGDDASLGNDATSKTDGAASKDGGAETDAAIDGSASKKDASTVGGGGPGAVCAFNRDCIAADRCACDESTGCFCEAGARGTGHNGIDPCTSGNDCTSSLCVEGPDGGSICSNECGSAADCTGALPKCSNIAFIGMICIRNP
ncbi:MAG: hypothetical protein ABI551_10700 [Polyangiaceae bacterium]